MSIYQMSAEERAQRAQEARARREERYTLAEYMRAQKRQEEERQRAIRQAQVEEENKIKSANPLLRAISTTGDIGANVTTGALKSLEGIVDLGAGIVGAVGGLASKDFREGTKKFISKDYTGEYVGKPLDELTKYSYLNTMPGGNIAEGVASGVGQMLPTVAITLLTGGTGTAPSLAGQAASTAGQAAATAGQVASKVGQVANMAYLTTSAAGNATESAYQDGADFYKGLGYGAASGALEGVTEKITGGFGGIVGKGLLDDVGKSLAKSTVGRVAKEAVGEGAEEVLAELANPALKSIYKGRDAFKEYGELDYWKGVGEAGLTGAGTSLVYGGTVGHGVKKKTGVNDAVTASLEDLEEITQRRKAFNVSGTRDETREAVLGRQAAQDYRQIEEVLKKSDASYREKVLSNYGLTDLFESDGSMKEELREQVERSFAPERAVVRDEQGNERELSRLDHRYSMLQDGKASTRIEAEEALRRSEATISSGELSATEAANLKKVRSFIGRLSDRGLVRSNLVVADMAGEDNGAVFGNTIVLNRKQLSKEDGWARTLIHEVEHLTEGTEEWETLAHFLLSSGNSDPAFEAVARNYFKGDETVGESALAKFRAEGGTFAELNEQEQLFLTELIAHETEVLFGSERMLKRLAKEKRSLAKRLLERIEDFFRILKMNKEERKAFVKLETARGYLEKALWAAGDARKKGDSVTENDESVVEKGDYVVSNEMNATTIHKNMNEKERYLILKDKTIHIHNSKSETEYVDDIVALQQLHPKAKSSAEKIIKPLVNKLGITTKMLSSPPVEIDFNYSMGNGLKESLSKQLRYGGNYNDFAHALINIDEILKNAVLIEIHDDKYKGTTREDEHLQSVYVLFSAIRHNETIVPVQMEIKESSDVGGRLSMLVTMTKIEADVLGSTPDINQAHSLISASTHSIAEIFKKINPADKHFLKYLPNNFLSKEQIIAKQEALKEDYDRISKYPKKSKADADFESFSAEDFFYEAEREKRLAEMDLKNMLPNREKSESAEKVPQRKKLTETKFEKSQIRGEITAAIDAVLAEHLDFREDFGRLIGKSREKMINAVLKILEAPSLSSQHDAAGKIADFILESAVLKDIFESKEFEEQVKLVNALRPYLKSIDLSEIKGGVQKVYGKNTSAFQRWNVRKNAEGIKIADAVEALQKQGIELPKRGEKYSNIEDPATALFVDLNEAYLTTMKELQEAAEKDIAEILSLDDGKILREHYIDSAMEQLKASAPVPALRTLFEDTIKKERKVKDGLLEENKSIKAYNTFSFALEKLKATLSGKYSNASVFKDERFKSTVGMLTKLSYRGNFNVTSGRKIVGSILEWYHKDNEWVKENGLYNEDIVERIKAFSKGDGRVTADEFEDLTKIVSYFDHFVQNYGKVFHRGEYIDAKEKAEEMVKIIEENRKYSVGWVMMLAGSDYAQMYADPMSVARRADMYNEKGFFTTMLYDFKRGGIDAAVHEMDLQASIREFEKKHKGYLKRAQTQTVQYHGGEIPKPVALGLYMSYKRQQAQAGLLFNGFTYKDEKGVRVRRGGVLRADQEYSAEEMKVQIREEQRILESAFDEADKAYIKALEEGYDKAKDLKRAEDLLRLGYTNALEGYYYPIRRANKAQDLDTSDLADEFGRVNSASFNQNTVKGAKQELFLEPANVVFDRHAKAVALYRGIGHVLDAYNILLNYNVGDNPNKPKSVATESSGILREKKGSSDPSTAAVRYIKDLVSDLQGGRKQSGGLYSILRSKYAVAVLGLNPKSWMSQFSSLIVSSSILDPSSIAQGFAADSKDVDKYCRLAEYRNTDATVAKAQGVIEGALDKTGQTLMAPIGKMDRLVVCKLFGACQVQVAKDTPELKIGSEENKVAAGELLEKVIMETQQGSLATEKSAAMRSGSELLKTLTMFKSDIMKVSSRVVDSFGELVVLKRKLKSAKGEQAKALEAQIKEAEKKCFRTMGAMTASAVYLALIAQAFRWIFRQDDEEEDKLQGFLLDAFGNMIGGLPFISEAYGFFTSGYEVNSFAYTLINDVLEAGKSLGDLAVSVAEGKADGKDLARTIKKLVLSMSQLAGVPAKNAYKLINGPVMKALEVASPGTVYKWDNLFFNQSYRKDLQKAVEHEDEEMIATIAGLIMDESIGAVEDDALRNTMRELLTASIYECAECGYSGEQWRGKCPSCGALNSMEQREQGYDVLPQSVGDSISYDGESYELSGAELKRFKQVYSAAGESAAKLVRLPAFAGEDQAVQAKALKFIYTTYYNLAKQEVLGVNLENKNVLFAEAIDVEKLAIIVSHCRSITADTDRTGKAIAGSKLAKIQTYVNSLGLSAAQKYMVMGYLGYRNKNGKSQVQAYINRLSLSAEEKAELLELSGYQKG